MIVVVTGTGTGVGKTHVAVALARYLAGRGPVVAWKPVESGVVGAPGAALGEDEAALAAVSALHVPAIRLAEPLSPHLAARRARVRLDPVALHARLDELAAAWPTLVVELAGGLCSPFDDDLDNAQWLAQASPAVRARQALLLVAADRLGVLHDVVASVHAARAHGLDVAAIALSTPVVVDASTGTNATELSARAAVRGLDVVALPRRSREELATVRELDTLAAALARGATADAPADRR